MNIPGLPAWVLPLIIVWSLLWKGLALWNSATHNQRNWFVIMLVLNTAGILEIVYLFAFAKEKMKLKDLMFWEKLS
ncbi:MAG TPA: DUF5652 family protein [Patescibacteria group bacterium]